jgi:uncharacterized membrane protein
MIPINLCHAHRLHIIVEPAARRLDATEAMLNGSYGAAAEPEAKTAGTVPVKKSSVRPSRGTKAPSKGPGTAPAEAPVAKPVTKKTAAGRTTRKAGSGR